MVYLICLSPSIQTAPSGQNPQNGFIAFFAKCTGLKAAVSMRVGAARFFVMPSEVEGPRGIPRSLLLRWLDYASLRSE
jgi:hypothetical protein